MSQTLTLPDELYVKLAHGAEQRGLTIEALLAFVSEAVVAPEHASKRDQKRSRRIEGLLAKHRAGRLSQEALADLEALIDMDYRQAIARADRLIGARKKRRADELPNLGAAQVPGSSRKAGKRSRT
jgi:hypothetical protein